MTIHRDQKLLPIFIGLLLFFFSTNIFASDYNVLDSVEKAAENLIKQQVTLPKKGELKVTAAELDSRLRFSTCSSPLEATLPGKQNLSGNVTVLVKCPTESWQLYVPVNVQLTLPKVVASVALGRGMVITRDKLSVQMVESRFQRGNSFEDPNEIIGSKVKRSVKLGEMIQARDICLVCRNDTVIIRAGTGGLNIVTEGKALSDGAIGEEIRVQNRTSRRMIDAIITAVGEVTVKY
ncbi:flagellar basal body P-ring biosynthesis protein [Photobacterium sp. SKA34]|uniref:flagellar basal body P-ring formation chaperone FlgA n=1 Tax=Photobacterium sp. SKA34 TaxID=121723 RepID=UPI00006B71FD|nr:flagellar basal body P-ring formation chaperone FlgA [Photobacterium sp. SKA34]EAR54331.1 flagellar basal body P-ring biosynthesis protein [Photobacterium sp. SKA34]